jgi:anti-anti-sigma factor
VEINRRDVHDVVVLDFKGRPAKGAEVVECRAWFETIILEGKRKLLMNLAGVETINSISLGIIISGQVAMQRAGGHVALVGVSERIHRVLDVTKFGPLFLVFATEREALDNFKVRADGAKSDEHD